MLFYSLLVIGFFALAILEERLTYFKVNKFILLAIKILPFAVLFVLNTFKSVDVGYDSINYYNWYNELMNGIQPGGSYPSVEKGFKLVTELFAKLKIPFLTYYGLLNLVIYGATGFAIIKLSKNASFSALVYTCLSVMVLNFSALRQAVAMALTLLSIYFLVKKKIWSTIVFVVLVIISGFFHKTGFFFIVAFPFIFIKFKAKYLIYITPFVIIFFFITPSLFQTIYYFSGAVAYMPTIREGVGEYYFIFYIIFLIFAILATVNPITTAVYKFLDKIKLKLFKNSHPCADDYQPITDEKTKMYILLLVLGVLFQSTSQVNYAAPRLSMQFLMLSSLFASNTLFGIKNAKFKYILVIATALCFYGFFLYDSLLANYLGIIPYHFL